MSRNTFRVAIRTFDPFAQTIKRQWDAFRQAEHVDLELEAVSFDLHPLYESYFTHEGLKRGDWDVGFLVSDWFATAHEQQAVLDLAPYLAANPPDDYPTGWTDSVLRMQRFGDSVIGLPYHDGPECLIYRKDLFDDPTEQANFRGQTGQELRPPQTWDEFRRIARYFTRPQQGLYGTIFAAYPDGHNTVYDFCLQLWTRGGELFDRTGNITLDTPRAIAALEFYRAMLNDTTATHPGSRDFDSVASGFAFARGEVAMMINWFGFAGMADTIPESQVSGKVDITTIPAGDGGAPVSLLVYWVLCIGAGSPHADIAYRFLRHCASAKMDRLLTLNGGIGCRKSTWYDPDVNAVISYYHKMESLHRSARELPRLAHWAAIAEVIDALVLDTINSPRSIPELTRSAQQKAAAFR